MIRINVCEGLWAYKCQNDDILRLGGPGLCDECNEQTLDGYLVPCLNHYQCRKCFVEWKKTAKWCPEDDWFQLRYSALYERLIPLQCSCLEDPFVDAFFDALSLLCGGEADL